mmetsp:Transcript_14520/g.21167  ORF Transcript_14520/g.21167 Transcript_14520/m.21167 type:complete len:148 (-) Transcript_14520:42-485(-)
MNSRYKGTLCQSNSKKVFFRRGYQIKKEKLRNISSLSSRNLVSSRNLKKPSVEVSNLTPSFIQQSSVTSLTKKIVLPKNYLPYRPCSRIRFLSQESTGKRSVTTATNQDSTGLPRRSRVVFNRMRTPLPWLCENRPDDSPICHLDDL